jgi:hypothetical protein
MHNHVQYIEKPLIALVGSTVCKQGYTKKTVMISPSLAGMSLTKLFLAGIIPGQGEFG